MKINFDLRKIAPLVVIAMLILVQSACGTNAAHPTTSPMPSVMATVQPTLLPPPPTVPTASPTASLTLDDFPVKTLMGEDEIYSVYTLNATTEEQLNQPNEIIIYDKNKNIVSQINGLFILITGGTRVSEDGKGKYVFLSPGTYSSRRAIVISLIDQKQAVAEFCTSAGEGADHLFWNDFIVYINCDTFSNRPWGAGEAPGITAIHLTDGVVTEIAKSDLTHQYQITSIEGDNLNYIETYVESGADWQDSSAQKTNPLTYDLSSLNP